MSQRNVFYYDQASNLSCVRDPDLGLTYYEYDLLDRVTSIKNPFGELTYYEYTPGGQVKQKILGNGTVSYYEYDAARRVSRIQHVKSDLSEIATLDYEYDRVGNPTKIAREDGSATYYSYDNIHQLTGETQVGSGGIEYAFEYDYDGAHNRTLKVVDGVPTYYTYNAANQLLTETTGGETTYYHYDGCGNTVAKQEVSGTTYYRYNTENLMTRIDFAAGSNYYEYDADSKRVSQRTADGFRQFVYQGPDMLKLQLERDESEETVAHYTMGAGLEAMRRSDASSFYHYNHLGTTLALTGADEAVSDTYRHDAWGVLLASTGSTVNPHTYVGRERYYRMPNAAMYHLGFRDYAQGVGRFTTVDPVRDGLNWFRYALNRPGLLLDTEGLLATLTGNCQDCVPKGPDEGKTYEKALSDSLKESKSKWLGAFYNYARSEGSTLDFGCIKQAIYWDHEFAGDDLPEVKIQCGHRWGCRGGNLGGYHPGYGKHIVICPVAFYDNKFDGPACVFVHELVHACGAGSTHKIHFDVIPTICEHVPAIKTACPVSFGKWCANQDVGVGGGGGW